MTEALTPQERRVVEAMFVAESEADAAKRLGLSRHTVHAYLATARGKRNVRTTRALIALELRTHERA